MSWNKFLIFFVLLNCITFAFAISEVEEKSIELETIPPAASNECFDIYLPQLQTAADQWSLNYNNCINTAGEERNLFYTQISNDQINITASSEKICDYIKNCQAITIAVDFFPCFSNLSDYALDAIYTISNEATEDLHSLTQKPNNIDDQMYHCTNDSQRIYVEQTAQIYDDLDNCLLHGETVTTLEPTENNEWAAITEEFLSENSDTSTGSDESSGSDENLSTTAEGDTTDFDYTTLAIMAV